MRAGQDVYSKPDKYFFMQKREMQQFNSLMSKVFAVWFAALETDKTYIWEHEDWIIWADNHIVQFNGVPPGWLCDISLAKSQKDVQVALKEGFDEWSRSMPRETVGEYYLNTNKIYVGFLYLKFNQNELNMADFLKQTWSFLHVGYLVYGLTEGLLEILLIEFQRDIKDPKAHAAFREKVRGIFTPFLNILLEYLQELPTHLIEV